MLDLPALCPPHTTSLGIGMVSFVEVSFVTFGQNVSGRAEDVNLLKFQESIDSLPANLGMIRVSGR